MTHFPSIPGIVLISSISAASLPLLSQEHDIATSQKWLDRFLDAARFNGAIFFYDEQGGKIAPAINRARAENPDIFDRLAYVFSRDIMPAAARKYNWPIEPRWWVVNKRGEVTFSSTEAPTEQEILKQLDDAGIQKQSEIYKRYIKENPHREDGIMRLLNLQYELASMKLRKKHLSDNGWNTSRGRIGFPIPELKRPLTDKEDEEIWADFANTLKLAVESEAYMQTHRHIEVITVGLRYLELFLTPGHFMALSPTMRTLATQLLPRVTQVVREFPENEYVWTLWLILERATGGTGSAIVPLLDTIKPRPFASIDFPPEFVIWRMRERLNDVGAAAEVEKYYKNRFDTLIKTPFDLSIGRSFASYRKNDLWTPASQLIYFYLRQNSEVEAERILTRFIEWADGDCKVQLDAAIGIATTLANAGEANQAVPARWREIDLESYKNTDRNKVIEDRNNLAWIVIDEDDNNDISDAFNSEINSYRLDSLPLPVKTGKRKDFPQFANRKPGWGLYNGKDFMFVYMENPPTYDLISDLASRNGIVSKVEEYEKFRKVNERNAHLELDLLREYLQLADKRMTRFNQAHPEKPMLDKDEDNIIWGPIAGILNELLSNGHYRLAMINVWLPIPDSVVQSQIMKNMAPRFIYQLEELIKRDPFCFLNYSLYSGLNELTGNKHSLIDILLHSAPEPKEGLSFNVLLSAIGYINKEALKRDEFDFIVDTSAKLWDFNLNFWRDGRKNKDDENFGLLGPLIEALLVKNMVVEAERIFTEFMETIPSQEIQKQLVQIANKREKPELARKWAAMRPNQSPNIGVL